MTRRADKPIRVQTRSRAISLIVSLVLSLTANLGMFAISTQAARAEAVSSVTVNVNMARILRIGSPAATVIVGNPGVADVTIQDPQTLILTGRSFGKTNLIVLDGVGNPIVDVTLSVVQQNAGLVTIYQGNAKTTVSCEPNCQPVVMLGDDTSFTSDAIASSSLLASQAN